MNPPSEETLFAEALARPPAERAAYLDQACGGDAILRARLETLLSAAEGARNFMETSPVARAADARRAIPEVPEEKPGDRIGRYKILQKLGEGGCGIVYVAEQEEPVRRRVALKVIKLGMDTKDVIARFEAERQALALMDHPNIAKVLDAGATDRGRPFFVMELVRGIPLTKYCDEHNATTTERLELFILICHAVQHAHQKGIIHRDLKPSNILVTINDGIAVPKIIDFGIAKATQGRLTDKTVYTAFEQFIGTPAYMSPEQAVMTSLDIDTRSDIYSLGVLLYELLTGRTPFDARELVQAGLDEIRRCIREVEPPKPSTRLSTMEGAALTAMAHLRQTEAPKLVSLVRGDLDWIVMRCLEKDRTRRYETANGLADDIRRHLTHEPVSASPPSAAYRFQKLVRRNRLAFAAAAAIAAALVIGAAVATWQAVRATRAEHRAQAERDAANTARQAEASARALAERRRTEVETINKLLLSEALGSVAPKSEADDPTLKAALEGREITLREVLDNAAARVSNAFSDNPLLEAAIRSTIGETYLKLSLYAKAAPHLQAAYDLRRTALGEEHPETLAALRRLTTIWQVQVKHDQVETTLKQILAVQERTRGVDDPEALETLWHLGQMKIMRLDFPMKPAEAAPLVADAIALARASLEKARKRFGADDPRTLRHLQNLFYIVVNHSSRLSADPVPRLQRAQEAEALGAQLLAAQRKVLGEAHPDTLETMVQYCKGLGAVGKGAEAERLQVAAIGLYERTYGPDHETLAIAVRSLAIRHLTAGRLVEAAEQCKRFAASVPKRNGWDSQHTRSFLQELGYVMVHCGKAAEAEAFALERLPEALRLTRPDSPGVIGLKFVLGAAVLAQGRAAEAEPLLRECLEFYQRQTIKGWRPEGLLGAALLEQKKFAEAEPLLLFGFEDYLRRRRETGGLSWFYFTLGDAYGRILKLYTEWQQPAKVAEWQTRQPEIAKVAPQRTWRKTPTPLSQLSNRSPVNLKFDLPATKPTANALAGDPGLPGWSGSGMLPRYRFEVDRAPQAGATTLRIAAGTAEPTSFVSLRQILRADDYRGRRVRFRLQMKTDGLPAENSASAHLMIERQDGAHVAYSYRRLLGTSDWRVQAVVFDVPANARAINYGLGLQGRGTLSVRELAFETVGPEVPADNTLEHLGVPALPAPIATAILNRKAPENLGFAGAGEETAQTALGVPAGWGKLESRPNSYRVGLDRTQTYSDPVSLHLQSADEEANAYTHISQSFSTESFRGKRVRFSAWVKAEATRRSPQLYLRIDSHTERSIVFDSSGTRATQGAPGWVEHTIVLDVPAEGDAIALGLSMFGAGEAWFNNVRFEVVGNDVPVTKAPAPPAISTGK